ncbi:MAG: hypothetical protein O2887_07910 [Bacteroidetes bacterium]|nr:hypothetical protein [Bacteroidota bacterium]MDA1120404.1 hypothetical protein [Bacteroidota bacterium]
MKVIFLFHFSVLSTCLFSQSLNNATQDYNDPIHFTPQLPIKKTVGDVMPFYWNGEYHIFYLTNPMGNHDVNWEHCSSTDLVNWKEYPPALKPDPNDPTGPEGGCMFTGCITEKDDVFYAWYTSWNPANADGREFLSLATSSDLINWTKRPEHRIAPDGITYANHRNRDFRDPQVFWNENKKEYWMHILANDASADPDEVGRGWKFGLLTSKDLIKWEQLPYVKFENAEGDECPDYFKIGDTHYINGCHRYYYADNIEGPYKHPAFSRTLDIPSIRASKRVWDGKRHVWFGGWSGDVMPMPREVYAGPVGLLYMKPVEEVYSVYKNKVLDLSEISLPSGEIDVPSYYFLDSEVTMSTYSKISFIFGGQYTMTLNSDTQQLSLIGSDFNTTIPCSVDTDKSVKVQVFIEGPLIECFINDRFPLSVVVKGPLPKKLVIEGRDENVKIKKLQGWTVQ